MIEITARLSEAGFHLPGAMIEIMARLSENRSPPFRAVIECGEKGASRPFRAVFAVLTGWDASGG